MNPFPAQAAAHDAIDAKRAAAQAEADDTSVALPPADEGAAVAGEAGSDAHAAGDDDKEDVPAEERKGEAPPRNGDDAKGGGNSEAALVTSVDSSICIPFHLRRCSLNVCIGSESTRTSVEPFHHRSAG
jgi:hypothetical protein